MKKINKSVKFLLALSVFLSTGSAVLANQHVQYPTDRATIPVNAHIGEFDPTDPGGGDLIDIDTGQPDPHHPNWLNISVPTAVAFNSTGVNHDVLESADFMITNHSGRGVDVSVADFEHIDGDMSAIDTLKLVPDTNQSVHSNEVELVAAGDTKSPNELLMTIQRVPNVGEERTSNFVFEGTAHPTTSTVAPSFALVLEFAVNGTY